MKKILLAAILITAPQVAFAADEFGTRFGGQTPAALSGTPSSDDRLMAFEAQQLQNIEAAAGEETEKFGPPVPASLQKKNDSQLTPETKTP